MIATRQMFYARLPQVKGTAGGVAFLLDEVMPASPAYRWTLNHTMRLDDPLELFSNLHRKGRDMTASRKLSEVAKTIRSKNAGVDKITFDLIFPDRANYERVRESGVLSRAALCRIFSINAAQITDHVAFDPALAIKFTIYRRIPPPPATPTSSAANNMARCSTSKCRQVEARASDGRLKVGCGWQEVLRRDASERRQRVKSRCDAVAVGRTYR